jgi:hypothetical protein
LINYEQIFAFLRDTKDEKIIVIINASDKKKECYLKHEKIGNYEWVDLLSNNNFIANDNTLKIILQPSWLRILKKT